jgi:hypothetical protein
LPSNNDPPNTRLTNGALTAVGGAIGTLIVFVIDLFVSIPREASAAVIAAITTIIVTVGTGGLKNFFVGLWKGVNGNGK